MVILITVVWVWVFESDAQAKTLGRDVILYAVRKQRIDNENSERGVLP